MESGKQFPKFHCIITDADEEFDSGVWEFFRHLIYLESDLGIMMHLDREWQANYAEMLRYVSDFGSSMILKRAPPDYSFLNKFLVDKPKDVDEADVLLQSRDEIPGKLIRAAAEIEELMAMYVRVSRLERFSAVFSSDRFEGLRSLGEALFIRAIKRAGR